MTKKFPLRTKGKQKLVQRFTKAITNFDEFTVEIKGVVNDVNRYEEIVSMFPFSVVGFKLHNGIKKGIQVELCKSIRDVSKPLENDFYGEIMLQFKKKLEVKGHGFDTYISISEGN